MVEALRRAEAECPSRSATSSVATWPTSARSSATAGAVKPPFLAESRAQDEAILDRAEAADPAGYFRVIAAEGDRRRICGLPPTWTVLASDPADARPGAALRPVRPPAGSESVSFASAAFYA